MSSFFNLISGALGFTNPPLHPPGEAPAPSGTHPPVPPPSLPIIPNVRAGPKVVVGKNQLQGEASKWLDRGQEFDMLFDLRHFALMNNASLLHDSYLQGHDPGICLEAYLNYVALLEKGFFFSHGIEDSVLKELKEALQFSRSMLLYEKAGVALDYFFSNAPEFLGGVKKVLSKINAALDKNGYAYFIAGYQNATGDLGHAITCKISKDPIQKKVTIAFFNLGEGSESHPELEATSQGIKVSYSYYPAIISIEQWDQIAPSFLSHLIRFSSKSSENSHQGYHTQAMYDMLGVFDSFAIKDLFNQKDKFAYFQQTISDCAEKAVRHIIIDFLSIQKQASQKALKIFLLNVHFASLVSSHANFLITRREDHKILLVDACEECAKLLLRLQADLETSEYQIASEMIDLILQTVQKHQTPPMHAGAAAQKWTTTTLFPIINSPSESLTIKEYGHKKTERSLFDARRDIITIPSFNPSTFLQDLKKVQVLQNSSRAEPLKAYVLTLPIPHRESAKKDAWDDVPHADIEGILVELRQMIESLRSGDIHSQQWLAMCTLYAIADKLVRKKHGLLLAFPFHLNHTHSHHFFLLGSHDQRYQQIKEYFRKTSEDCQGKIHPLQGNDSFFSFLTAPSPLEWELQILTEIAQIVLKSGLSSTLSYEEQAEVGPALWGMTFPYPRKQSTANEILCKHLQLPQEERRSAASRLSAELSLLLHHPKLQFGLAVQWIQRQQHTLNQAEVQDVIQMALFSDGALKMQMDQGLAVGDELRALIKSCFDLYGDRYENISANLFLIRIGTILESHLAAYLNQQINQEELKKYRTKLKCLQDSIQFAGEKEDEEKYYLQAIATECFLETCIERHTLEEFINLYTNVLKLCISEGIGLGGFDSHLIFQQRMFRLTLFNKLQSFVEKEGAHVWSVICNAIVSRIINSPLNLSWRFLPSTAEVFSDDYVINFVAGTIDDVLTGRTLARSDKRERQYLNYEELGVNPNTLWFEAGLSRVSLDRMEMMFSVHRQSYVVKNYPSHFVNRLVFFSSEQDQMLPFLRSLPFIFYSGRDEKYVLAYLPNQGPFMRIALSPLGTSARRVDDKANDLPYLLVNLQNLAPNHPVHAYTLRFARPNDILCFINEATKDIQELYFTRLNLSFKESGGRLMSQEFPGYYLAPLHVAALKSHNRDAMILRNMEGNIKVLLIPALREKKQLISENEEKNITLEWGAKYYAYDLASVDAPLKCKKASEKLFLIYFFKTHGNYDAAFEELNRLDSPIIDLEFFDIFLGFLSLSDESPRSIGFNQRLILYVMDRLHLIQGYGDKGVPHRFSLKLSSACRWYENYLFAVADDQVNGIPIEWRLSEKEEERIFEVMERENVKFSKVLEIRKAMILSSERSAQVPFNSLAISLIPEPFQRIIPPQEWSDIIAYRGRIHSSDRWIDYPNLVSETYCQTFFTQLYEKALKVPADSKVDPFDFTLLALLRSGRSLISLELASLLVFVRYFPSYFQNLSVKNQSGFERVVAMAKQVALSSAGQDLQKKWKSKVLLPEIKQMTVALPPLREITPKPLTPGTPLNFTQNPFEQYFLDLFTIPPPVSPLENLQLFESSLLTDLLPAEQEILNKYNKAITELAKQSTQSFTLKPENLSRVALNLKKAKENCEKEIERQKKKIHECLNNPYETYQGINQEAEFRLRLNAHQTYVMTPEMVMKEVILKDSTAFFDEHRPMLLPEHVQEIVSDVNRYYHLLVMSAHCSDILKLVERVQSQPKDAVLQQDLFHSLGYKFEYHPEEFPEIGYMKVKTGKLPRKDQLEVYRLIKEAMVNNKNLSFQLPAGGGKTSYLIPLMILGCKRFKLVPFVLTTQAMYGIERENLKNTLHRLGQELGTLEVDMHTRLTLTKLKWIYRQLVVAVQVGKATLITPQTFYALRLSYFTLEDAQHEERELLRKILEFFKRRALFIGDESHRNYDPMTQAIYGIGDFVTLREKEQNLLMTLAKPLFGMENLPYQEGVFLSEIAASTELGRGVPSKEERQEIAIFLANHLLATHFKNIPATEHEEIRQFLVAKSKPKPSYLNQLSLEEQDLIYLGRYFFRYLLKQILQMKTDFDHVHSPEQGGIDAPSHYKTPSHAQFKDHYLTFLLSIKGTWRRGLDKSQFANIIKWLRERDAEERELAPRCDQTPHQQTFKKWVSAEFPELTLESFEIAGQKVYDAVFSMCSKQVSVIEYYLTQMVLPRVGHCAEQFTSTPADLMSAPKMSIICSATPLDKIAYPQELKETKTDDVFEARVVAESARKRNQNYIFPKDVEGFFAQIGKQKSNYGDVRHMIDAGGFLCHEANDAVARKWLMSSDLDGVIFFKEGSTSYDETLCVCMVNRSEEINFREIEFSRIDELQSTLEMHRVWKQGLKIGVFFDSPHAESAHFDPQPDTAAFVLAGDSLTLSHTIQAIMRERGFLNEAIQQRIIWVVQEDLKVKMQGKCPTFSNAVIHTWCLKNEAKAQRMGRVMAAYQDIAFKIEQEARKRSPGAYRAGLREKISPRPTSESQKIMTSTSKVLWQFAGDYYARFLPGPLEDNIPLKEAISPTIVQVSAKIPTLAVDFRKTAIQEMHQKFVVNQQMRAVQQLHDMSAVNPAPLLGHPIITDPDYPAKMQKHGQLVSKQFDTSKLTDHFYLESNQICTGRNDNEPLKERFLKPISFLLIVCHAGRAMAEAVSIDLLPSYIEGLENDPPSSKMSHKAFIIRADGIPYYKGKGGLAPTDAEMTQVLRSLWMEDVLIDTALLNGRIPSSRRFKERVHTWPDFPHFFEKVLKAQVIEKEIAESTIISYLPKGQEDKN